MSHTVTIVQCYMVSYTNLVCALCRGPHMAWKGSEALQAPAVSSAAAPADMPRDCSPGPGGGFHASIICSSGTSGTGHLCLPPPLDFLPLLTLLSCPFMQWAVALHWPVWLSPLAALHLSCCATLQMGPGQSLMHLASDAVRAAAESPFLEEAVKKASAILCCISMPSPKQRCAGMPRLACVEPSA